MPQLGGFPPTKSKYQVDRSSKCVGSSLHQLKQPSHWQTQLRGAVTFPESSGQSGRESQEYERLMDIRTMYTGCGVYLL